MISQRMFLAIALGVVALGGCKGSKPPVAASTAPKIAADAPSRTPGLWSLVMTLEGQPGTTTVTLCLDPETDKKFSWWGDATSDLCDTTLQKEDGDWKFASSCKAPKGDMAIVRRGTARGDFKTSYSLDGDLSITGSPDPRLSGTKAFTASATYSGQCPSDMPPGTMNIPGVGVVDPTTLAKAQ